MASRSVILLVVLACLLHRAGADCKDEGQTCDQCYQTLASYLVNTSDNKYELRRVFYPLERASPIFVTVTYQYIGTNTTNTSKVWYWSDGVFYFFQPPRVFLLTSLLFGGPYFRISSLNITLPAECESAPEEFMTELTQLLKLYASWSDVNPRIDNTYRGHAYNLDTLNQDLYTDNFLNADHPILLYCFQFLFPPLTMFLVMVYGLYSRKSIDLKKHAQDLNSLAIASAHAAISALFVLFVCILDIIAVIMRNETLEYYSDMHNELLFHYPGVVIFWDLIALIATVILLITIVSTRDGERVFLLVIMVGVVPILCFASHAHYIVIAWITDPFYATSIGIYYGVCYIIHLLLFKRIYKGAHYNKQDFISLCSNALRNKCEPTQLCLSKCKKPVVCNRKAMCTAVIVLIIALFYQGLITVFFVFIPINNAIENTPSRLFIAIQSVGALLLVFIAYRAIVGKESLSIVIGAIRNVVNRIPPKKCKLYTDPTQWDKLGNEEKFTEVLHHVFKINNMDGVDGDTSSKGITTSV